MDETTVFEDVLEGLKETLEWAKGKKELRVTRVILPAPPPAYSAAEIRSIRDRTGMSQALFSRYLSVSRKTLQAWEQGTRHPSSISARFLQIIDRSPDILATLS